MSSYQMGKKLSSCHTKIREFTEKAVEQARYE